MSSESTWELTWSIKDTNRSVSYLQADISHLKGEDKSGSQLWFSPVSEQPWKSIRWFCTLRTSNWSNTTRTYGKFPQIIELRCYGFQSGLVSVKMNMSLYFSGVDALEIALFPRALVTSCEVKVTGIIWMSVRSGTMLRNKQTYDFHLAFEQWVLRKYD